MSLMPTAESIKTLIRHAFSYAVAVQQDHVAGFTSAEAAAIVAYLRFRLVGDEPEFSRQSVREALENYWLARAGL